MGVPGGGAGGANGKGPPGGAPGGPLPVLADDGGPGGGMDQVLLDGTKSPSVDSDHLMQGVRARLFRRPAPPTRSARLLALHLQQGSALFLWLSLPLHVPISQQQGHAHVNEITALCKYYPPTTPSASVHSQQHRSAQSAAPYPTNQNCCQAGAPRHKL